MKAMIFAAGLGTRLRPLTDNIPKALIKIHNLTLLEIAILQLKKHQISEIIINVHHHAEMMKQFIGELNIPNVQLTISDESSQLLNTGGGLKKAAHFFNDEPFIVVNVDCITDLNYSELINAFHESRSLATLAVRNRSTQRYLLFDSDNLLRGWENHTTGEKRVLISYSEPLHALAFSGIQVLSPQIFNLFPESNIFSIIDLYLSVCESRRIIAYPHDKSIWLDVGKPDTLAAAEKLITRISL